MDLAQVTGKFKDFGSIPADQTASPFLEAQTRQAVEPFDGMSTRYFSPTNADKKEEVFVPAVHPTTEVQSPQ